MSEHGKDAEAIFLAALDKEAPPARAAYVESACAGNVELLRRVHELLASHDVSLGPLDNPPPGLGGTIDVPTPIERSGTMIGPYKLLQKIGEGGMGTVYMAEQTEPVKRKVALKVIKAGMDSQQVIARFEAERQALAMMDHVNIARVLDAGTTGEPDASARDKAPTLAYASAGRPYFVMELVHGIPITKYCDDNHLTPRQRLELFVPVCQAIQHAHQKGIIHRDIKPSNVMVTLYDGKPVPKVIDFGVAKAIEQKLTERTLFTQYGTMVGTLEYMSPEQAEMSALGVDTRSDIFSLGVLLYELLTGSTPLTHKRLKDAAFGEILRLIREEEAPKPSTRLSDSGEALASISAQRQMEPAKLTNLVRGELDWIVMKCLEKDRNRRYETANAFAADVQRYLADETVQACPPSALYRLRKFIRRNRGPTLAAAGFAALVVFGIAGLIVGIVAVSAERQRTANALVQVTGEQARTQLALTAETNARRQTREALNAMTDDVIETLFAKQAQLGDNEKAFLRKVLGFYQTFAAEQGETEEARWVAADGQFRVAHVRASLGETSEAANGYREASRLFEKLAADFSTLPVYQQAVANSQTGLGGQLRVLGKLPEAETAFRQAVAIQGQLATDFPTVAEYRKELARSHNNLSVVLKDLGNMPASETAHVQALTIQEKLATDFPTVAVYRQELARSYSNRGIRLRDLGKRPEAEMAFRQSLAIREKLVAEFPTVPVQRQDLASSLHNVGLLLSEQGKRPEAEIAIRQALAIYEKLAADLPTMPGYRQDLATAHNNLGRLLVSLGKPAEAEAAYRQALGIREKLAANAPGVPWFRIDLAESCINIGILLHAQRRSLDALEWYAKAIPPLEAHLARDTRLTRDRRLLRDAYRGQACALTRLQRHPEALKNWDRAIELDPGPEQPKLRLGRDTTQARAGDHARAVTEADDLTRSETTPGDTLYIAAGVYGVSVAAVKDDAALKEQYAKKALALLRRAQAADYFKDAPSVEDLQKNDDLAALRDRADFKELIAALKASKVKK